MPMIPATFVQGLPAFGPSVAGNFTQNLPFTSNVTQGNLIYVYVFGSVGILSGGTPTGNTLTFGSVFDSQGNSYLGSGMVTVTDSDGPPTLNTQQAYFGLFVAFAKNSGACTVSATWTATGGNSKTSRLNIAEYKNVSSFDRFAQGTSTSIPAVTPTPALSTSDNELYIASEGFSFGPGPGFAGAGWGGLGWTSRISAGSPSVGPVWDGLVGPTGGDITQNLTAANLNGATYYTSCALFRSASASDPNNGNVFLSQYPRMTWMKNVMFLCRDYWDQALSSPYVGQIWPAPNSGGARSGQTYPY